ncbi:MAG: bifunctional diguanylate cyclase/phosphodiesterase [Lachnospiraceae bacterium]|nr:bifunctional diguanylate cyclase/phosphodiesterase [Lachnospiraceae bacterium]
METNNTLMQHLKELFRAAALENTLENIYEPICKSLHIVKMYYDMNLGDENRYRDHRTGKLVLDVDEENHMIVLYDGKEPGGIRRQFNYYYNGFEYVHAYIEFEQWVQEKDLDNELYEFLADVVYIIASRKNMREMLDHAENSDFLTGIPNIALVTKRYYKMLQTYSPEELVVLRMNLRNFRYINEVAGAKAGDEAIIKYAHKLVQLVEDDECVGRMGGDNFLVYLHQEHLKGFLKKVKKVKISKLESAPKNRFEVEAWIGVSKLSQKENKTFIERMNDANIACGIGKTRLKKGVVCFDEELKGLIMQGRDVIDAFPRAIEKHEFVPFFQPKVDMSTGELVGFEALCRWFHDGHYIFPDQFIPTLDKEGVISELDLAIFRETCAAIFRWKEMGLTPPRISCNFSKKNLYIPGIEARIMKVVEEHHILPSDVEIEITESMKDVEYHRLIEFVKSLKEQGFHISIDDFGTGYSSLSLLHNIEADVIKIDKSFTDKLTTDQKSVILVESIVSIGHKLHMEIVAEGVETREQGKILMEIGCNIAQGYYYSKPVDYETTTGIIKDCNYQPIAGE